MNNSKRQKNKRKYIKFKLWLNKFLKEQLWQHIIVIAFICFCAWLFNKPYEAVMFCVSHIVIRLYFDKQYHCDHKIQAVATLMCLSLTLTIAFFGIATCLPISLSLLSTIPVACLICWVGYIVQDRIDKAIEIRELNKYVEELLSNIGHKDIWAMSDTELYEHCRSCGLSEEDCKIAYFIVIERLKGKELYKTIGYSERQTIRKRKDILKIIK